MHRVRQRKATPLNTGRATENPPQVRVQPPALRFFSPAFRGWSAGRSAEAALSIEQAGACAHNMQRSTQTRRGEDFERVSPVSTRCHTLKANTLKHVPTKMLGDMDAMA